MKRFVLLALVLLLAGCATPEGFQPALRPAASTESDSGDLQARYDALKASYDEQGRELTRLKGLTASPAREELDAARADNGALELRLSVAEASLRAVRDELNATKRNLDATASQITNEYAGHPVLVGRSQRVVHNGGSDLDVEVLALETVTHDAFGEWNVAFDARYLTAIKPVCTSSMKPTLTCDDVLLVYEPEVTDVDVGDILVYSLTRDTTCDRDWVGKFVHRVTDIDYDDGTVYYSLQGDNNRDEDPCLVPHNLVDGKVLAIIKDSKTP